MFNCSLINVCCTSGQHHRFLAQRSEWTDRKQRKKREGEREGQRGEWGEKDLGEEVEKVNVEIEGKIGSGQRSEGEKKKQIERVKNLTEWKKEFKWKSKRVMERQTVAIQQNHKAEEGLMNSSEADGK